MIEKPITWQHVLHYRTTIRRLPQYEPLPIKYLFKPNTSIIPFGKTTQVFKLRDWVYHAVGDSHKFNGIFAEDHDLCIPSAFRFLFDDLETAVLCKLTWG